MHQKAKELLAMIFLAVKDFKTISMLGNTHEFTLTLWCITIGNDLALCFVQFVTNNTVSPCDRNTWHMFGFKHRSRRWSPWPPTSMKRGVAVFIKITDLANQLIPKITL